MRGPVFGLASVSRVYFSGPMPIAHYLYYVRFLVIPDVGRCVSTLTSSPFGAASPEDDWRTPEQGTRSPQPAHFELCCPAPISFLALQQTQEGFAHYFQRKLSNTCLRRVLFVCYCCLSPLFPVFCTLAQSSSAHPRCLQLLEDNLMLSLPVWPGHNPAGHKPAESLSLARRESSGKAYIRAWHAQSNYVDWAFANSFFIWKQINSWELSERRALSLWFIICLSSNEWMVGRASACLFQQLSSPWFKCWEKPHSKLWSHEMILCSSFM